MKVLIIGGVAGGASAAARLRRLDEGCEIIMFERGEHISFANCGLPYFIGGEIREESDLLLQSPKSFNSRFNVDVRTLNEVQSIDTKAKCVTVRDLRADYVYDETYDVLLLSMGAKPLIPDIEGAKSGRVFALRNVPDAVKIKKYIEEEKPGSVVVAGGGAIGVEMAENLKGLGLDVTIVELSEHLIASLDGDMAAAVHNYMREKGIKLILGNGIRKIEERGGLSITLREGTLCADMLIMSVGVRPETELAQKAGISLDNRGCIIVDSGMKTSAEDVYAVGDVVEVRDFLTGKAAFVPLAGPANRQGRIAADNICGIRSLYGGTQGSSVIKAFDMTVAVTGLNERAVEKAGVEYDKTYIYAGSHASYYPGSAKMCLKILWEKKNARVLGAQIVGFGGADKRADVLATAIRFGAKVTDLVNLELCYAPPFGSAKDPVNMLGFVAENVISGKIKQFFWHDVAGLSYNPKALLLDVRTDEEYSRGKIEGCMHIPLHLLRENLDRIPAGKELYIYCDSGLRSYIACRILRAKGFETYNLAGGYRFYSSVVNQKKLEEYNCTKQK